LSLIREGETGGPPSPGPPSRALTSRPQRRSWTSLEFLFRMCRVDVGVNVKWNVGGRGIVAAIPPGWYPDPQQRDAQRYWDGQAWTSWVNTNAPAGSGLQQAGRQISRLGVNLIWIVVGLAFLLLIVLFI